MAACGTISPPWGTLGDHGSSRKDALWSSMRFIVRDDFGTSFFELAGHHRAEFVLCFMFVSRSLLAPIFTLNASLGAPKRRICCESCCKTNFRRSRNSADSVLSVSCLSDFWVAFCWIFAALEAGLEINKCSEVLRESRSKATCTK